MVEDVRMIFLIKCNMACDSRFSQFHRQIGNAVPVPLALALGKSLGESLLKTWAEEEREGSVEV